MVKFPWSTAPSAGKADIGKSIPAFPKRDPVLEDIPDLIECLQSSDDGRIGGPSAVALRRLYLLADVKHKENREPMVCSGVYDVLTPLTRVLDTDAVDSMDCGRIRMALLALNNLSIPLKNKQVMLEGPASDALINSLCNLAVEGGKSTYLAIICLMNLTFPEEGVERVMRHSPSPPGKTLLPVDNPKSLLRGLQRIVSAAGKQEQKITPQSQPKESGLISSFFKKQPDVRKEAAELLRLQAAAEQWATCLLKNLSTSETNAAIIARTGIPKSIVETIRIASPPSGWAANSLEDLSLTCVLNLAQWPTTRASLIKAGTNSTIKPILAEEGLHTLKATMVCTFLGVEWSAFPISAAASVTELMANIMDEKEIDGRYPHISFRLSTATSAFRELLRIAATSEDSEANVRRLATAEAVAVNLQVISDFVIAATKKPSSAQSAFTLRKEPTAEVAAFALEALEIMILPALNTGGPSNESALSEEAATVTSEMLLHYEVTLEGDRSEERMIVRKIANAVKSAAGTSCPVLEGSYSLWSEYSTRREKPLNQFYTPASADTDSGIV